MTYKKVYLLLFIYCAIAYGCLQLFEHRLLLPFLMVGGILLSVLLKGYAKDHKNRQ